MHFVAKTIPWGHGEGGEGKGLGRIPIGYVLPFMGIQALQCNIPLLVVCVYIPPPHGWYLLRAKEESEDPACHLYSIIIFFSTILIYNHFLFIFLLLIYSFNSLFLLSALGWWYPLNLGVQPNLLEALHTLIHSICLAFIYVAGFIFGPCSPSLVAPYRSTCLSAWWGSDVRCAPKFVPVDTLPLMFNSPIPVSLRSPPSPLSFSWMAICHLGLTWVHSNLGHNLGSIERSATLGCRRSTSRCA